MVRNSQLNVKYMQQHIISNVLFRKHPRLLDLFDCEITLDTCPHGETLLGALSAQWTSATVSNK